MEKITEKKQITNISFDNNKYNILLSTNYGFIKYNVVSSLFELYPMSGSIGKMHCDETYTIYSGGDVNSICPSNVFTVTNGNVTKQVDVKQKILNIFIVKDFRIKIIIVLVNSINIYDINGNLLIVQYTYNNPLGICDVKINKSGSVFIACLGENIGDVKMWNYTKDITNKINIGGLNKIENLKLNNDASLYAVVVNPSIINIHRTDNSTLFKNVRRGTDMITKTIHDISFSLDNKYIACCSSTSTIHIFTLNKDKTIENKKSMFNFAKQYLPNYFSSEWAFKTIKLIQSFPLYCMFDNINQLHVCSTNGEYFKISGDNFVNVEKKKLLN